ncbi:MAG: chemotaxis response regulator protein-glutamate methylesterase [Deltaproteobacteria bacterium]|nr:chemotaxis response regulator protein-glutamate methylesterase [Deltaproteobacteria bacterium]
MIKVLVVEDSPVVREFLVHILNSDPELRVVGTATDGEDALEAVKSKKPDVITMDIHMPKMDGFEATRKIMETHPMPIVIVTGSSSAAEVANTFHALEAGALSVIPRPKGIGHPEYERTARELIQTVKLMSEVKVVRRWPQLRKKPAISSTLKTTIERAAQEIRIVAIGASTGGPIALQTILSQLPAGFPVPVVIVQHMASGFIEGFVEWLAQSSGLPVHVASHGEHLQPGHIYVAPDGFHMGVGAGDRLMLSTQEAENGLRPAVCYLFRSVAEFYGRNAIGVLLTGMGRDGAEGLRLMREKGAITVAQDEQTSVVYGMPREALELDAAVYVLPPQRIAGLLVSLAERKRRETNHEIPEESQKR